MSNAAEYWAERQAEAQANLTKKTIKETEKELTKYYRRSLHKIIGQFETTYNTYLANTARGLESSPATLYKLDSYWNLQVQMREELQKLGDFQSVLFSKQFTKEYLRIYRQIALHDGGAFSNISQEVAQQVINQIWCADGSTWSNRIWKNTSQLQNALNEGLIDCVLGGKPAEALKARIRDEFGVSYSKADNIVRTELAHVQTQAARQRYTDRGVKEVEVWADKDERQCEHCGKLHQKRFPIGGAMPVPAHPRCRCVILPVVDIEPLENEQLKLDGF